MSPHVFETSVRHRLRIINIERIYLDTKGIQHTLAHSANTWDFPNGKISNKIKNGLAGEWQGKLTVRLILKEMKEWVSLKLRAQNEDSLPCLSRSLLG
jgi:hypothetical protein